MIGRVPDTGVLSTNFVIPDSLHVFILVGFSVTDPAAFQGELQLSNKRGTNFFSFSNNSPEANWLSLWGLNSVFIISNSLTSTVFGGRYLPGDKCNISAVVTNGPKASAIYIGYLK